MKRTFTLTLFFQQNIFRTLVACTFIVINTNLLAQDFTWMRGSALNASIASVFGTPGVSAPTNEPGTRHGANTWVDSNGDLWMFGGEGPGQYWHSDLWKYTVSTNEWTFIKGGTSPNQFSIYGTQGVASPTNNPGAREFSFSWVDAQGKFWLFGGDGFGNTSPQVNAQCLADLWKFDPVTSEWTFVKGTTATVTAGSYGTLGVSSSSNMPGARRASASWVDANGNLWMFGGHGYAATTTSLVYLNDLWKFDIGTNQWTWMGGANFGNQNAVNGTLNVPASTNRPGAAEFASAWEHNGMFYMFGGKGYCSLTSVGWLNDMWKYDPTTGVWTWIAGSNLTNQLGHYGTLGVAGSTVLPGCRQAAACWKDLSGDLWIFGGDGFSSTTIGLLNDVFKYNLSTNQFTWVKGPNLPYIDGTNGTMGLSSPSTIPGARTYNTYWTTSKGEGWLLGGEGLDSTSNSLTDNMQDLWRISLPCTVDSLVAAPQASICNGQTATLTAFHRINSSVNWYLTASLGSAVATGTTLNTSNLYTGTTPTVYTYYAEVSSCSLSPRASIDVTVNPSPTITVAGPTDLCISNSGIFVANGAASYSWTGGPVGNTYTVTPQTTTDYTVVGTSLLNCTDTTVVTLIVNPNPTIAVSGPTAQCKASSGTLTASGAITYSWTGGPVNDSYTVNPQTTTVYTVQGSNEFNCTGTATVSIQVFNTPTLTLLTASNVICKGHSATLTVSGAASYSWSVGQFTSTSIVVTPSSNTVYSVTGKDVNNCSTTAVKTITVSLCTSLASDNFPLSAFKVFPNPGKEKFILELPVLPEGDLTFVIFNQLGQIVSEQKIMQLSNVVELNQQSGIYFYRLTLNNSTHASGKLIVE
ncbi:hypothetical protein CNR22_08415 [Sphingobacteriaceae bacterium]|nr:hypothetical protein CNR22_08415 [Sphingobacteriaceae bacterium]